MDREWSPDLTAKTLTHVSYEWAPRPLLSLPLAPLSLSFLSHSLSPPPGCRSSTR